ncbi:Ethanolamine ammonia-lyase light chain [Poseidonocella pacifica]|uniref:Ethanolamine ammonia-lyase small subunit n=1 Tax=Poseidonocella pacifica TaxID=871651 RepID=A0A1I0WH93_9RHOB|nr:ethanolamine ammonia-lyase subunit EutC [Poseidonocella pacifica]SFA88119.1 Ethanolamine ammonia-lyase light chain [Poseidonocella pacifica]
MTRTLSKLSELTPARVRLDAKATPLPLRNLLNFQEDHASARDAIFEKVDWTQLEATVGPLHHVRSRAHSREEYLRRPDLGRTLSRDASIPSSRPKLAIVLADGLSPPALVRQAPLVIAALREQNEDARDAPVFAASEARVALGDAVGEAAGAEMVLVLIGERPGLSVSSSLGAYLTYAPRPGTRDSARNCVSNIHDKGGLTAEKAASRLSWLIVAAQRAGQTGVALKDESPVDPSLPSPTQDIKET